jgi:hypothetical protein
VIRRSNLCAISKHVAMLNSSGSARSADIAANKPSVPKRTGKFSSWSDAAATQQVAANRERTVRSNTNLFSTTRYQYGHSRSVVAFMASLFRDGTHQRRGVDLIGYGGLGHIDDCEEQELGIVKDCETSHLGSGKGE